MGSRTNGLPMLHDAVSDQVEMLVAQLVYQAPCGRMRRD